jgi:Condensation domain/AMP-binding enzyme
LSVQDRISSLSPAHKALLEKLVAEKKRAAAPAQAPPSIPRASGPDGAGDWPLSFDQERLWILSQLDPEGTAYNLLSVTRLGGALDVPALHGALAEIFRRQGAWRTTFPAVDGVPVQRVSPAAGRPLPVVDLTALSPVVREATAQALVRAATRHLARADRVLCSVLRRPPPAAPRAAGAVRRLRGLAARLVARGDAHRRARLVAGAAPRLPAGAGAARRPAAAGDRVDPRRPDPIAYRARSHPRPARAGTGRTGEPAGATLLHRLFEAQAALTPGAVAVETIDGSARLTYADLNVRAECLARHLQDLGIGPETRVGLSVERSPEMLVGTPRSTTPWPACGAARTTSA